MKRTFKDWQAEVLTIVSGLPGHRASEVVIENAKADLAAENITRRTYNCALNWASDLFLEDRL